MAITRLIDGTIIDNLQPRQPIGNIQSQGLQDIMARDIYKYKNPVRNVDYNKINQLVNKATSAIEGGTQSPSSIREIRITKTPKPVNVPNQVLRYISKNLPTVANAGKGAMNIARAAGPYAGALATGATIGDILNTITGRPTTIDAIQSLRYRNPNRNKLTLKSLSEEEIARLPESTKQALMNNGFGYILNIEDNEVADVTNNLRRAKQPTANSPVVAKKTTSNVLRDASGNVILPSLPNTSTTGDLLDISTALGGASGISQLVDDTGNIVENVDKLDKLLELYNKRLELNKPYIEQLQDYTDNYRELQRQAYLRDVQRAGINDYIHGTNTASQLLGKYNPAEIEATRLDLLNKLLQTKANELSGMDELIGRVALTETGNLPIEAALADKDTFKAMSPILSSINALRGKTYSTDINSRTKLQIAKMNLEGMLQRAKMNNDAAAQRVIANQLGNVNRALITSMGFNGVSPVGLADLYNQMGYGKLDTSNLQGMDLQEIMNNL